MHILMLVIIENFLHSPVPLCHNYVNQGRPLVDLKQINKVDTPHQQYCHDIKYFPKEVAICISCPIPICTQVKEIKSQTGHHYSQDQCELDGSYDVNGNDVIRLNPIRICYDLYFLLTLPNQPGHWNVVQSGKYYWEGIV